jgi:hypothetical protein
MHLTLFVFSSLEGIVLSRAGDGENYLKKRKDLAGCGGTGL